MSFRARIDELNRVSLPLADLDVHDGLVDLSDVPDEQRELVAQQLRDTNWFDEVDDEPAPAEGAKPEDQPAPNDPAPGERLEA